MVARVDKERYRSRRGILRESRPQDYDMDEAYVEGRR